jgi:hypothetical protein
LTTKKSPPIDIAEHEKSRSGNLEEARARLEKRVSPYSEEAPLEPWDEGLPEVSGNLEEK